MSGVAAKIGASIGVLGLVFLIPIAAGTQDANADDEVAYLRETDAAMATMMRGMDVRRSGDADRDFVEGMSAHHQGAIDMAKALLRYGKNPQLKRIAQEIVITQEQEKVAMRHALLPLPADGSAAVTIDRTASK